MSELSCGIVGLPNVGKSTLFAALTAIEVDAANYPFCTIEPNVGIVEVPDPRLQILSGLSGSKKIIPAAMRFVDIAGLVEGASKGEGLGNKFLDNIRKNDAIIHVVRCFENDEITHVSGKVDPLDDVSVINLELVLADLQSCEKSLLKIEKQAKSDKSYQELALTLKKVKEHLNEGKPVRTLNLSNEELKQLIPYPFLSAKKVLYVANVAEDDLENPEQNPHVQALKTYAEAEGNAVIPLCVELEQQIVRLPESERLDMLQAMGLKESGLDRLIKASFSLLGLITYLTTGEVETRAWTIKHDTPAPEAAGAIHSDLQRGFIRAEVIAYNDYVTCKTRVGAREAGKARSEGKEYLVKDGDVILFHHN